MSTILMLAAALQLANAAVDPSIRDPAEKSCPEGAVPLLILGSYHMDNPGLDAVNIEADDVLAPRRQSEIAALNEALLEFRPTKVAVEGDRSRSTWQDRYKAWLSGDYSLGRNEIEQIGMRVARAAGHSTIYPVDFPMLMSGLRYDEVEFKRPKRSISADPRELTEQELLLRGSTVAEFLRRLNTPNAIAENHKPYMELLEPDPEDPVLYARSDALTNWYKRNIRIMTNVARISEAGDRMLLVIGSGHLPILREFAIHSPKFCLVDTLRYLPPSGG